MLKLKATKKTMRDGYRKIISIGYCDAEAILNYQNPIAYSTRVEGWACDYYDVNGVLLSTGYSPLSNKNTKDGYKVIREYNAKAREIIRSNIDYEAKKEQVNKILLEMVATLTAQGEK